MTSQFDKLMGIFEVLTGKMKETFTTEDGRKADAAEWLFDICIKQANEKETGWNFEAWKKKEGFYQDYYKGHPFFLKAHFLDECHDHLDHKDFHLQVFDIFTDVLIAILYDAIIGRKDIFLFESARKKFPELSVHLRNLGYSPQDKEQNFWILSSGQKPSSREG